MCGTSSHLEYSPRRLVAFAVDAGAGPTGGSGGSRAGAGVGMGADNAGDGSSQPPAEPSGPPDPRTALRNWRQPMPLGRKIRIGVRNTLIKIRTHQTCCGNYGEPGC
jgi:hypothetical protein